MMYAHSIKNPHIIHFRVKRTLWYEPLSKHKYICCSSYTESKATDVPSKVTCKNCLKILEATE